MKNPKKLLAEEQSKHSSARSQTPGSSKASVKSARSKTSQKKNMTDLRSQVIQQSRLSATKTP